METNEHNLQDKSTNDGNGHPHLVVVKIDGREVQIEAKTYPIPELKRLLSVPLEYELELVQGGHFKPLDDGSTHKVHQHEEFISHVRCGSSS